ncbi:hypothetical protein HQN87_08940 [Paenibacillus tritici]|uniref:Thioredoxin domain-containing protein n=1 Tax=Paenibacillus tritici TaxID=1873425 RepID=A0ABX2DN37_9BACL|nr:hypothetical protein [Paenibacillus tritici]NQX45453.1 hypothetical protein [Paenibacillus tritici]
MFLIQLSIFFQWTLNIVIVYLLIKIIKKSSIQEIPSSIQAAQPIEKYEVSNSENFNMDIGSIFPEKSLVTIGGNLLHIKQSDFKGTILFISVHGCESCEILYQNINSIIDSYVDYQIGLIMVGPYEKMMEKQHYYQLVVPIHHIEMHQMEKFGTRTFPFCYILSGEGIILNKRPIQDSSNIQIMIEEMKNEILADNFSFRENTLSLSESSTLDIGTLFPYKVLITISDGLLHIIQSNYKSTILLFSIHGCESCETLYQNIKLIREENALYQIGLVMVGPYEKMMEKKQLYHLDIPIHHIEMDQMEKFQTRTFPFCYIISGDGTILNKRPIQDFAGVQILLEEIERELAIG